MAKKAKHPTEVHQRAKHIADIATGVNGGTLLLPDGKTPAAVTPGRTP